MKLARTKKIGVDLLILSQFADTGMVSYTTAILPYLFRAMPEYEFILFCKKGSVLPIGPEMAANTRIIPSRWMRSAWVWKLIGVSVAAWTWKLDLLFLPVARAPLWKTCKVASFLHDVGFLSGPEYLSAGTLWPTKLATWMVARSADLILTNSCFTRDEFCSHYNVSLSRVVVTYLGYEAELFHEATVTETEAARVRERYVLEQPYVLYLGVIQGRKNLKTLIAACTLWARTQPDLKLVLAGRRGWNCEEIYAAAQATEQVRMPGRIETEDLPALYKLAACYVLPSLYEGFGMPVIESMACGTPNVLARQAALPEVGAAAAAYFHPLQVEQMAQTILDVVNDPDQRASMRAAGLERCKDFTWSKVCEDTAEALRRILE